MSWSCNNCGNFSNLPRIFQTLTKNVFFRNLIENMFHCFLTIFNFSEHFRLFRAFPKILRIFLRKFSQNIVFLVFCFSPSVFQSIRAVNYVNLVANLRMGIYEDHLLTNQISIQPVWSPSDRMAYNNKNY